MILYAIDPNDVERHHFIRARVKDFLETVLCILDARHLSYLFTVFIFKKLSQSP